MNCMCKLDPFTFATWVQTLVRTASENTDLYLLQNPRGGNVVETLTSEAVSKGLRPDRLKFLGFTAHKVDHHYRMRIIDLHLGPVAVNGGSTTLDALFEATPLLTLPGDHMGNRFGATALHAVGLSGNSVIVSTRKQYEDQASELS